MREYTELVYATLLLWGVFKGVRREVLLLSLFALLTHGVYMVTKDYVFVVPWFYLYSSLLCLFWTCLVYLWCRGVGYITLCCITGMVIMNAMRLTDIEFFKQIYTPMFMIGYAGVVLEIIWETKNDKQS